MANYSMRLRGIVGIIATSLALKQILSVNTLRFDHNQYHKNSSIISIVNLGWVKPKKGQLVLVHNQSKQDGIKYVFRIVQQLQHQYTHQRNGFRVWIPDGFLLLNDPIANTHQLKALGQVASVNHIKCWTRIQ